MKIILALFLAIFFPIQAITAESGKDLNVGRLSYKSIAIATGHKTGTVLAQQLMTVIGKYLNKSVFVLEGGGKNLIKSSGAVYRTHSFYDIIPLIEESASNKVVVIIRHPLELCISAARYHVTSSEPWLQEFRISINETYQKFIRKLNESNQILFEFSCGACQSTIREMLAVQKRFSQNRFKKQVLFMHLERFKTHFNHSISEIGKHFGFGNPAWLVNRAQKLSYEKFVNSTHSSLRSEKANESEVKRAVQSVFEFPSVLQCEHYAYFAHYFGLKSLETLTYHDTIPLIRDTVASNCGLSINSSSFYRLFKPNNCTCGSQSGLPFNFIGCAE